MGPVKTPIYAMEKDCKTQASVLSSRESAAELKCRFGTKEMLSEANTSARMCEKKTEKTTSRALPRNAEHLVAHQINKPAPLASPTGPCFSSYGTLLWRLQLQVIQYPVCSRHSYNNFLDRPLASYHTIENQITNHME